MSRFTYPSGLRGEWVLFEPAYEVRSKIDPGDHAESKQIRIFSSLRFNSQGQGFIQLDRHRAKDLMTEIEAALFGGGDK